MLEGNYDCYVFFLLKTYSIYTDEFQIPHLKKKNTRSCPGQELTGRVITPTSLLINPDWSSPWIDLPGLSGLIIDMKIKI